MKFVLMCGVAVWLRCELCGYINIKRNFPKQEEMWISPRYWRWVGQIRKKLPDTTSAWFMYYLCWPFLQFSTDNNKKEDIKFSAPGVTFIGHIQGQKIGKLNK
jgi:hypothetical protein